MRLPTKLSIQIWQKSGSSKFASKKMLAQISPALYIGYPGQHLQTYEFSEDPQTFKGSKDDQEHRFSVGTIDIQAYVEPEEGKLLTYPNVDSKIKKRLAADPSQFIHPDSLTEYAQSHDPNDPYVLAQVAMFSAKQATERLAGHFKLDAACKSVELSSMIPVSPSLLLQQQLDLMKKKDSENENDPSKIGKDTFLNRIKDTDIVKNTRVVHKLELKDVVREPSIPTLPSVFKFFTYLLEMYRPLKPIRKERVVSSTLESYSKLVMRIVRGLNIPVRSIRGTGPGSATSLIYSSTSQNYTNAFVRVSYINQFNETTKISSNGPDTDWNNAFEFKISEKPDYVPTIDELSKTSIRLDLFDHIKFNVKTDDRLKQTEQDRYENRHLGSITIPISSIWASGIVNGTVPLNTPMYQLGYELRESTPQINIYFTLDPPIRLPETVPESDSSEDFEVKVRAAKWVEEMKAKLPTRRVSIFAPTTNGKPVLLCRMITAQNPPPGFGTPDQLLRFVSMIPNYSDSDVFQTEADVWCTSQEFLSIKAGDQEEHATLLANYFKFLGKDVFIALGYDHIIGSTAYVITKESGRVTLWNPVLGKKWEGKNQFCPLYSIGVVFNEENIWANIQIEGEPYKLDWNFSDKSKWFPFFTQDFPKTNLASPQDSNLTYFEKKDDEARRTERYLKNEITAAVEKFRNHQKTSWNYNFSDTLKSTLKECEKAAMNNTMGNFSSQMERISSDFSRYRINGGPFCMPYTNVDAILDEIKRQEIWKTESPKVEFACAVDVIAYPNDLLIAWIVIATLEYITPPN